MKKKMKLNNSRFHRWTAIWLALVLVFGIFTTPVKVYANPYGGGDGNCTYTAWRLAYANTGIQLPGWGNAHTWYDSARNAGYTVSTVPRAKSIAVWSGGPSGYGHVAYVTEVRGDQIYIQEGGYNGAYHEGWENAYGQTKYYSSNLLTMIGYIYLGDTSPTIPSGYLDYGQSFDAIIIRTDVWKHVTVNGDNVELSSENKGAAKQHWHFERQSDGSYIITSLYDGRALDVSGAGTANGTNVGLCQKWGTDNGAQKWYIYGNQAARRLVPKNAPDKCLDCATGSAAAGTNIQIFEWNQSEAQVFSIYEIENKMPKRVDDKANYFLEVGETCPITATVEPADSHYRDLNYFVADPAIATVKDGKLTAVAQGTTTLTITSAYSDKIKCTVNVNVSNTHPTIKAEIREIKEKSIVIYVEAEDDRYITHLRFTVLGCYNPETDESFADSDAGSTEKDIGSKSFAGEVEIPLYRDKLVGDEHAISVAAYDDSGMDVGIFIPFKLPGGLQIPMKTGETIDEKTLFEKGGKPNITPNEWTLYRYQTTDFVSFTEGSKTEGAADYQNGTYTMEKPGRYSLAYINNESGEILAVTFDITCGHHWGGWKTIQEADCVNAGKRQHTCENCGETETKTTTALGHTVVIDKAVAATTSSTGLTKGSHCSVCGKVLEAQRTVPKLTKVTKPKAPTIKLTTKKRTVQIKISKVKGASGYQIYRSRSKSYGYKKITSTKKTSYTNKGLTAKKIYYYKVRAYKTTKGKKVYGNWSKVLKIKVKK
jgi:Surface antigen